MTKKCGKCKISKNKEDFNWLNKSRNEKQRFCRECMRLARKKSYQKHKSKHVANVMKRNKRVRLENIKQVVDYLKLHPCVDCGEKDITVLHFDHLRDKYKEVGLLVSQSFCWKTIQKEIDKCEVRCANCHMRKTAKDFNWKKCSCG